MEKIYYNNNGWVCQRYPYDLPIENENQFGKNLVPKNYEDNWKNTNPEECRICKTLEGVKCCGYIKNKICTTNFRP